MATTIIGKAAETAVANYLTTQGFSLIDQNWRTRWCEVDLIVKRAKVVYFIEVKYRSAQYQGSGLEYIGPNKLKQLLLAVSLWCQQQGWSGDCRLLAVEVSGMDFQNIKVVEID